MDWRRMKRNKVLVTHMFPLEWQISQWWRLCVRKLNLKSGFPLIDKSNRKFLDFCGFINVMTHN